MKVNKKHILVILLFIFVICLSYLNKPRVLLSEVKLIDENKNVNSFAIMISDDGENYTESDSNMIPSAGYKLNLTKSYCTTLAGEILTNIISEPSFGMVKVETTNTVNCYLYYDPDNSGFATVIGESDYTLYTDEANLEAGTFYRYSGDYDGKRNVIYADHCWQIIRTTKNNSIKMIYNGEPIYDSSLDRYICDNSRSNTNHIGYTGSTSRQTLGASSGSAYNYYYGTGYYYDETAGAYKLSGEVGPYNWYNDYNTIIGMYTCKKTTANASCTMGQIYYVESYYSQTHAYVFTINTGMTYDRIGTTPFNYLSTSPADVGYMYNTRYDIFSKQKTVRMNQTVNLSSSNLTTWSNYYYGDRQPRSNTLYNPVKGSDITGYPQSWVGKYTLRSANQNYSSGSAYYISGVNGTMLYYSDTGMFTNDEPENKYLIAETCSSNGDGTYTCTSSEEFGIGDWYALYRGGSLNTMKYVCEPRTYTYDSTNNTGVCSGVYWITGVGVSTMTIMPVMIKYGYSFEERTATEQQDGKGRYKLVGNNDLTNSLHTITNWNTGYNTLTNSHYTCFNEDGICDTLYFVTYASSTYLNYIEIPSNKSINTIVDEMLNNNDINTYNSAIKSMIDLWYKEHILNKEDTNHKQYSSYLDTDEIFCNNRSSLNNYGGWNQAANPNEYLKFVGSLVYPTDKVSCIDTSGNERILDEFSVTSGNESLIYPIGFPSATEMFLLSTNASNSLVRKSPYTTGIAYWLSSPGTFEPLGSYVRYVDGNGAVIYYLIHSQYGVRPSLSLNRNVVFSSGDGTLTNPWVASLE